MGIPYRFREFSSHSPLGRRLLGGYLEAKRKDQDQKRVKEQIQDILKQIEKANEEEQAEYGEWDLEEMGGHGTPDIVGQRLKKIEESN